MSWLGPIAPEKGDVFWVGRRTSTTLRTPRNQKQIQRSAAPTRVIPRLKRVTIAMLTASLRRHQALTAPRCQSSRGWQRGCRMAEPKKPLPPAEGAHGAGGCADKWPEPMAGPMPDPEPV